MRLSHFEAISPICPNCMLQAIYDNITLEIKKIIKRDGDFIVYGLIECPNCRMEYPIIDGLVLLLANIKQYINTSLYGLLLRDDIPSVIMDSLSNTADQNSTLPMIRRYQSAYGWDHWDDLSSSAKPCQCASIIRLLDAGLALTTPFISHENDIYLDLGCGPGRSSFNIAQKYKGRVVGIELDAVFARMAMQALRYGRVQYPLCRSGSIYEHKSFDIDLPNQDQVDFWIADATALPLAANISQMIVALNLIDCTNSPRSLIAAIAKTLMPQGQSVISTPYDWNENVTAKDDWLTAVTLKQTLESAGLKLGAETEMAWHVRLHERSIMNYQSHVIAATKE